MANIASLVNIMKSAIRCVFKAINIKTDLSDLPPEKATRYTGWLVDLNEKAMKLPMDKRKKILDKLTNFVNGDVNIITKKPKKTKYLFSVREISSLSGLLVHFCILQRSLIPALTPFYRLLDNWDFAGKNPWSVVKRLNLVKNKWLGFAVNKIFDAVYKNEWIPFTQVACSYGQRKRNILESHYV